jgi:hypothetical protein
MRLILPYTERGIIVKSLENNRLILADRVCFSRLHDDKTSGQDLELIGMFAGSRPVQHLNKYKSIDGFRYKNI